MLEAAGNVIISDVEKVIERTLAAANLKVIQSSTSTGNFKLAGTTIIDNSPVVIGMDLDLSTSKLRIKVGSNHAIYGSMLLAKLKEALGKQ